MVMLADLRIYSRLMEVVTLVKNVSNSNFYL